MKKNYAYTFSENQTSSYRLWRFFTVAILCFLLSPVAGSYANAQSDTATESNEMFVLIQRIAGGPDLTCDNPEIKFTGQAFMNGLYTTEGVTYSWTGPGGFKSTDATIVVTVPGEYVFTAQHSSGASAYAWDIVKGPLFPAGFAGPDIEMGPSDTSVRLQPTGLNGNFDYSWTASDGGNIVSGHEDYIPTVNAPGTYTLTITSRVSGCTMQDQVVVKRVENTLAAIIYTRDTRGFDCDVKSVVLEGIASHNGSNVTEGVTFSWSGPNGFTSNQKYIAAPEPGIYTLQVSHAATGKTASTYHIMNAPIYPFGSAGPDKKLTCDNPTVMLEGTSKGGASIVWLPSDGGNIVSGHFTLNPIVDAPGTYTLVMRTLLNYCTVMYQVKVTHEDELTVSATGGKLECSSAAVQLKAETNQEGVTYNWTGPDGYTSTEQNPTVKVAGDYKLTVTNPATGCTASTSVVVTPVSKEMEITHHMIDFNSEKRGLISSINTEAGPVAIMGRKRNANGSYAPENHAAIFDTQDPTGDDTNLYTADWGHALIINQYHNDYPDANQWGGELILDFSAIGPVTMESLKVVGMDLYEQKSWVYLYDANGKELHKEYMKPLGMNSKQTIDLGNTRGVMKMKVVLDGLNDMWQLSGSAAIDDIKFKVETMVENPCDVVAENITHAVAYPTSFSEQTKVEFIVRETENYSLNLYDTQGMLVAQLKEGTARAGEMTTVEVNGRNLKEGMYLARLVTDSGAKTFRLILKR